MSTFCVVFKILFLLVLLGEILSYLLDKVLQLFDRFYPW